jgi:hypothetical protein
MLAKRHSIWVMATLAATLVVVAASAAFGNAANPLPTTTAIATQNADGSVTVTVHGSWDWQSQTGTSADPCGGTRFGVGWAVAWGDPNAPGHAVTKGSTTLLVGTPTDNAVHFDAADPCGVLGPGNHPTGPWGPESHTYGAGTPVGQVCVNMYDLHDTQAKKPGDYVAGGPGHNKDNSIETNAFDPNGAGFCSQPTVGGGTEVPVGSMGVVGLSVLLGGGLLVVSRRRRPGHAG